MAEDLAKGPRPAEVHLFRYIDDILLSSNSLAELEKAVPQVLLHLKSCFWAVNEAKLQGPGLSIKFLRVVWSGKTKVIADAVMAKIQVCLTTTTVKHSCGSVCALPYSSHFPLLCLAEKGSKLGLDPDLGTSVPRSVAHQ